MLCTLYECTTDIHTKQKRFSNFNRKTKCWTSFGCYFNVGAFVNPGPGYPRNTSRGLNHSKPLHIFITKVGSTFSLDCCVTGILLSLTKTNTYYYINPRLSILMKNYPLSFSTTSSIT